MKRFLVILICATLSGLFYVCEQVEAVKVGYTIRKQEETKTLLLDRSRALKYNIARLKAPHSLEQRLLAERIELQAPKSWQTLVLSSGLPARNTTLMQPRMEHSLLGKFFLGTAQAQTKETRTQVS